MTRLDQYFEKLKDKKVLVLGVGVSNRPLVRLLLRYGVDVTCCDKTPREKLDALLNRLQLLMAQINLTNSRTVSGGQTLTELIARRDCLTKRVGIMRSFLDNASARTDRYSQKEIKVLSTVPVSTLQKQVDAVSRELREVDEQIQSLNWTTELTE